MTIGLLVLRLQVCHPNYYAHRYPHRLSMILEEPDTAPALFDAALERYQAACPAIANRYDPAKPLKSISRAISEIIPSESELIASYEKNLEQVKAIVSQTRNISPAILPINALPSDALAHIFQLIRNADPELHSLAP